MNLNVEETTDPSFCKSLNFSVNKYLFSFDFGLGININQRALENC